MAADQKALSTVALGASLALLTIAGSAQIARSLSDHQIAVTTDHLARARRHRDALRDRRRAAGRRGQQLRHLSARGEDAAERRRAARSERRAHPVAEAGSRRRLRQPDGPEAAARARRHRRLRLSARRTGRRDDDHPRARRDGRATRPGPTRSRTRIERGLDDIRRKVRGRPRPRTLLVFGRERLALRGIYASGGIGFLARHARRRRRRQRVRRRQDARRCRPAPSRSSRGGPTSILETRAANSAFAAGDRRVRS